MCNKAVVIFCTYTSFDWIFDFSTIFLRGFVSNYRLASSLSPCPHFSVVSLKSCQSGPILSFLRIIDTSDFGHCEFLVFPLSARSFKIKLKRSIFLFLVARSIGRIRMFTGREATRNTYRVYDVKRFLTCP